MEFRARFYNPAPSRSSLTTSPVHSAHPVLSRGSAGPTCSSRHYPVVSTGIIVPKAVERLLPRYTPAIRRSWIRKTGIRAPMAPVVAIEVVALAVVAADTCTVGH